MEEIKKVNETEVKVEHLHEVYVCEYTRQCLRENGDWRQKGIQSYFKVIKSIIWI